jgi:SAM-dependent methyltransferase
MSRRTDARSFFDAIAGRYDREYAPPREESRTRMTRVLAELAPRSKVLDLGVGTGRELSSLQDAGHDVTGLDWSAEMLARCARRARPVELILADFWLKLPFHTGAFGAVLALHGTLAHPPREDALETLGREIARVLSSRGVFVAELPLPGWMTKASSEAERRPRRIGETRVVVSDDATGATIEASLLPAVTWQTLLSRNLKVTKTIEGEHELFLVAHKG